LSSFSSVSNVRFPTKAVYGGAVGNGTLGLGSLSAKPVYQITISQDISDMENGIMEKNDLPREALSGIESKYPGSPFFGPVLGSLATATIQI
jgi:hypothetical protein